MANERVTEEILRQHLREFGIDGQVVEEQASTSDRVRKALKRASKSGDGVGKPEFIVQFPDEPNLVLVVECKASERKHQSAERNRAKDYAVDGVLHYASELSKDFDVIALAVSGVRASSLRVSAFQWRRKAAAPSDLVSRSGPIRGLVPLVEMVRAFKFDPDVRRDSYDELMAFSRILHNYMRDKAKLSESEKPLVVSGILLALRDQPFANTWNNFRVGDLGSQLLEAIKREAKQAFSDSGKLKVMLQPYGFLETHPELNKATAGNWPLKQLVSESAWG